MDRILISRFGLAFKPDGDFYIPYKFNARYEGDKLIGSTIAIDSQDIVGKAMFDFIMFAKSSSVESDENGNSLEGYLDIYQYCIAYIVIRHLLSLDSADILSAIARQAKQNLVCINFFNSGKPKEEILWQS